MKRSQLVLVVAAFAVLGLWFVGGPRFFFAPSPSLAELQVPPHALAPAVVVGQQPAPRAPAQNDGPKSTLAPVPAASAPLPQSLRDFFDRLRQLNACYEAECDYPQTDPRSYNFALGQDLKSTLRQMSEWVREQGLQQPDIAETARKFLASGDGHVQEAALDLLATQPASAENLAAIIQNVLEGSDSALIAQALSELQRYTASADVDQINEALARALSTGAPFLAREVSARISPFLNDNTFPFFQDLATRLPEQSIYRLNLENSLAAFQRHRGDG